VNLVDRHNRYATLAGYLLSHLGHLPVTGERVLDQGLAFEIVETDGRNIGKVRISVRAALADPS
ncbi:transporter associated domain-containing protein, partial [Acinetobacter baumannii]|uniref:transporter associated domain-containing protein n=1 Tax=Acinetobacter baumannii TaxID=470 RepID=UPI0025AF0696